MTDTALDRVVRQAGDPALVDRLTAMPGADLTTLLLRVMRSRADRLTPADVLRRYREDRFVAPATVPFGRLRAAEDGLISLLPQGFQVLTLAPVTPLGTHSVVGTVHQDNVVTTVRGTEVAADATNGLTLEAAHRRQRSLTADPRSRAVVRLAAAQRVVRAQLVSGAGRFAHFSLFGLVTAGRDTGDLAFEREHILEHVRFLVAAIRNRTDNALELRLTVGDKRFTPVADAIRAGVPDVDVTDDPDRVAGSGYYAGLCYKVLVTRGGDRIDIGDGGVLDWTRQLLGNNKERLVTSGLGIDGIASL
ncbi:MAG TPA: hypothetical protein VHF06_21605 [Pseudonocardiaceae bacterium]|nr:hypothetical protein [Pseudonocardiaceae bacterium]